MVALPRALRWTLPSTENWLVGWLSLFHPRLRPNLEPLLLDEWFTVLLTWCFGVVLVHLCVFVVRQARALSRLASETDIDLLNLEPLQVFSAQPIRFLLIVATFVSLNVLLVDVLMEGVPQQGAVLLYMLGPVLGIIAVLWFAFCHPVLLVRNRVKAAKDVELQAVCAALSGDRSSLSTTSIGRFAKEFTAPDLLNYEQRVLQIWEWPIQSSLQRILIYVMLPPLAWVLAALAERWVDMAF